MVLPPGVSQKDFTGAINKFKKIVGSEWVFTSDEDLHLYRDAYSPAWGEDIELLASAALAPDNAEEVKAIVAVANEFNIPLYPVSTGMNLTYGGAAPTYSGSVVLELKRMNRILNVDVEGSTCLVEPGVSYYDMYRYLRDNKIPLWVDTADPGWGSLMGNALDRGVGKTMREFRDHFDAHCGMEVVLGNGDVVRTGMGAMENADTWQDFKYGLGPWMDGMFSQSNFGIVTKMGFWLMPEPESAMVVRVESPKRDDVHKHVGAMAKLLHKQVINSRVGTSSPAMYSPMTPELFELRADPKKATSAQWDSYAEKIGKPFWSTNFALYGTKKIIAAQWECIQEHFSDIDGVQFIVEGEYNFPLSDEQVDVVRRKAILGIPSLAYFGTRDNSEMAPRQAHNDFSPVVPMKGQAFLDALDAVGEVFAKYGFEFMGRGGGGRENGRAMVMLHEVLFTKDPVHNKKARALYTELVNLCGKHGWGEYRIHPMWQKQAMDFYNFNDGALHRLHETIKDAIDPNGIISPGRYNIWPKRLREEKE